MRTIRAAPFFDMFVLLSHSTVQCLTRTDHPSELQAQQNPTETQRPLRCSMAGG